MEYKRNGLISAKQIANLRQAVGWNRMEECYKNPKMISYYHVACYDNNELIGYVDSVCNGLTDAYIQDLMVHPNYQGKGVGTELMNIIINRLKEDHIYMISVVFEDKLLPFYKRFGFQDMLCGQMQTYQVD